MTTINVQQNQRGEYVVSVNGTWISGIYDSHDAAVVASLADVSRLSLLWQNRIAAQSVNAILSVSDVLPLAGVDTSAKGRGMTPYDELIARISDLIRDGDRTVEKRAHDMVGLFLADDYFLRLARVQFRHFDEWDEIDRAKCIEAMREEAEYALKSMPMETPFLTKYKP